MVNRGFKNRLFKCVQSSTSALLLAVLICLEIGVLFNHGISFVLATAGDFSVFRNANDETAIPADGSEVEVLWDTVISENAAIDLLAGSTTIDLVETGKYLVLYNVWADGSSGGTNRRSFETYLTLNETELAYGRGDGYIRDASGADVYAYANGAAVIDASAGDDLKINIARDDSNSTESTTVRAGTNGVSIVRLKDEFDYLRIYKDTRSDDISGNTSFTDVVWDQSDEVDSGSFGFSNGTSSITLKGNAGDHFLVTANVRLNQDANSGNRQNYEMRFTRDGVEIPGTRVTTYPRGNASSNGVYNGTLTYVGLIQKATSDDETFVVEVRRESQAAAATDIVANETALTMVALPSNANYIYLSSASAQDLQDSRTPLNFDDQFELATSTFSHSTTVNPSRVNIDQAGDYLFFSHAYATRTSSTNRDPIRVDWRLDGSTILEYGGHGSFNRGDQGTNLDAYTSGSAGGIIIPNLTDSQYLEVTAFDELDAANSTFNAGHIALQGVEMSLLFQTNVEVSATGTHATSTRIPTVDRELGGSFVITENTASRNVTNITLNESGSVDAANGIDNIELYYDLDTTAPYDCASESFSATSTETQFGQTDTNGFSGADGSASFSDSVTITTTQTMCVYVVYDVTEVASNGDTLEISIADPVTDIGVTGGASIGPASVVAPNASTTLLNAELTQNHYHIRNDDGAEGAATSATGGVEDSPLEALQIGTPKRIRLGISNEGNIDSLTNNYRLEFTTEEAGSCADSSGWTEVDAAVDAWDMYDSSHLTNGTDATNIAVNIGGVSDEASSFVTSNAGLLDSTSESGDLIIGKDEFVELEYAIVPTVSAVEGTTYCFRVTNAGTALRQYDVYPAITINADATVSATSTQVATVEVGSTNNYLGGAFVIADNASNRDVTSLTITETGSVNASTTLDNPTLYTEFDTTAPYDCASESYSGAEASVAGTAFSGSNGSSTFTGTWSISTTSTLCAYVVFDVNGEATNGDTIDIEIASPASDVLVTAGSVAPTSPVAITGSTTISGAVITQTGYHWRNDNGDETDGGGGATSATGGNENTALTDVPRHTTYRVRMAISNEGNVTSQPENYRLEYGAKITTCDAVSGWQDIDVGAAFVMSSSSELVEGNDTTNIVLASGGVTDPNLTFETPNSGQKEDSSQTADITLSSSDFVELEYAIEATDDAGFDTTYCFRVTASSTPLAAYSEYPELTTREKQDFFIQRGTVFVSGTSSILEAGIDYIAPAATSSAFVRITGSQMTGSGRSSQGTQNADDVTAYIEDQSDITDQIIIARPTTAINDTRVDWEIVEYTGLNGADNEVIVRDVGTVTYGSSALSATGTAVSGVADDSDVVVFITGQVHPDIGTGNYLGNQSTARWNAVTNEPVFDRETSSGGASGVSYAIVEFTGLNWKVQRVEHNYTFGNSGNAEQEPIEAVNSITRTFIHAQKRVGDSIDNGLNDYGHQVWMSSIGFVSFQIEPVSVGDETEHYSVAWVIENTQTGDGAMEVHHLNGSVDGNEAVEPRTTSVSIGETLGNISNASLFITNDSSGDGTAFPRAMLGATIASTTHFELYESDAGQIQEYRVNIIEWPVAQLAFQQNYYRFYVDNDALTPTDPWPAGGTDLGENTPVTAADDPLGEGERIRIRMTLNVSNATFPESTKSFKLQYGRRDGVSCAAIDEGSWSDVGSVGSGSVWRGYDATPDDGTEVPSTLLGMNGVAATYEEVNSSSVNPNAADVDDEVEYDWLIEHNGATQRSDYCFRMVESDGTTLTAYNNYPVLRTSGYTPIIANWRWYDDENNLTPTNPLAAENVTPIEVSDNNPIKLRVTAAEVESAPGNNIKFALQYSQSSDFSDGGTTLTATTACNGILLWCYVDGAGEDNAVIDEKVLSDSDACTGGVGAGCGTHNEAANTASTMSHPALGNIELEFTLQHTGVRANGVYYFRLYDVTNDEAVQASSTYPSVVTEGALLSFSVVGLPIATTTEGIVTDATTTSNSINFGSVGLSTEVEVAHRLAVETNATEGYQVFMFSTQPLLNTYGVAIPDITSTNDSPAGWSTACTGGTTGCFGYHAGDDILAGGSTRFSASDSYAALTTEPAEIMYSAVPVSESHDVIYKIQVEEGQPAGDYETDIVYLAVPVF